MSQFELKVLPRKESQANRALGDTLARTRRVARVLPRNGRLRTGSILVRAQYRWERRVSGVDGDTLARMRGTARE